MGKRFRAPLGLEYSYQIYPPSGGHKGFRIIKIYKASGRTETVSPPELSSINEKFIGGTLDKVKARQEIEKIRMYLYEKDGVKSITLVYHPENKKVMNQYWESEYVPKLKNLEDPKTAKAELERAITAVGPLSLKSATKQQLQKQIAKSVQGNRQSRVISKVNVLLKYLNRDIELEPLKRTRTQLKHISLEDLPKLLQCLPDENIRILHAVCFYTGVLIGEAFALDARTYNPGSDTIRVMSQVNKLGTKKDVRDSKARTTVVIPEGKETLIHWFQIRGHFPLATRLKISRYTRRAAMEAFPDSSIKHITFADLRDSYAFHLLSKGVPIALVAKCLGVEESYARERYVGFDLHDSSIELVSKALKSS